jgi:hypothetical protein
MNVALNKKGYDSFEEVMKKDQQVVYELNVIRDKL